MYTPSHQHCPVVAPVHPFPKAATTVSSLPVRSTMAKVPLNPAGVRMYAHTRYTPVTGAVQEPSVAER